MSETTTPEDISSTTAGNDEDNPIYQPEDNPHWSTSLLETQELSTLYTENTDSKTMSTSPGNVSSIDEEKSAAEATDIADNTEPVYHNNCVNQFEQNPEDNHGASGPPVDASDLEDTDRAPAGNIQHPDTTGSLDDTIINPDTGDLDISDNIEAYANERSNEPDTPDCEDQNNRVLTNPMYEELPDTSTQQTADNVSNKHDLQGPSNTNDSKDDSPIYRYWWLIVLVIFPVMVGLITTGILVGMKHNTQDHGNPTVPPMYMQESTNWSTTFIVMTEPDNANQTSLGDTDELGTQKPEIGTILTFGGFGKVWRRQGGSWKKMRKRKLYGKFNQVTGVAVSSNDEVFVSDKWNRRIQVFSMKVQAFRPEELMWLKWPASVAVDKEGNIYITEQQTHNVLKYDKNGKYINCFGRKGDESSNHLKSPVGICVDSLGRIIVADNGNNRVEMFTAEGEYIANIAYITRPQFVAIGREGQLIVSSQNNYVTIFPKY
ncbi:hypothetical protein Bbelb_289140 [Branchiostoma belcheri]|nr:hypothetical protein Bbelb_289140 [Branchiostoma belcheri]